MRKLIIGVLVAGLVLFTTNGLQATEEILKRDANRNVGNGGINASGEMRNQRMTDEGYLIISAGGNTLPTASYILDALGNTINPAEQETLAQLDWRSNTGNGWLGVISAQLNTITATSANQVIANTSLDAIDAGVTVSNTSLNAIDAGVTVGNASLDAIDAGVTVTNTALGVISGDTTSIDGKISVGGGLEASAILVTLPTDSTGLLSVDDNGGSLTVDGSVAATQSGTWNITNVSGTVSLPTGAATSANQTTGNGSLSSIDGKLVSGTDIGDVTINNAGAGSAVNIQDGGNSLTIDGDIGFTEAVSIAAGQSVGLTDGSESMMIDNGAVYDGILVRLTDGTNMSSLSGTGDLEVSGDGGVALATQATLATIDTDTGVIAGDTTSLDTKIPSQGAAASAASLPVVIASDQAPVTTIIDNATGSDAAIVQGSGADGAAIGTAGDPILISGTTGGNIQTVKVDAGGAVQVDVESSPALAATTDAVAALVSTDGLMQGTTVIASARAIIDYAGAGDNTLKTAVAGKKIRVLSLFMVAAGAVNVRFESGAGGTALTGQMEFIANEGFVLSYNPLGWFETGTNTLLNMELSGAVSCDGSFTYILVD